MYLYQPVVQSLLTIKDDDFNYIFGIGNQGVQSDLIGLLSTWVFYYSMIHVMYYVMGGFMKWYATIVWPEAGTNQISDDLSSEHIKSSEAAFPLYSMVPVIGDFLRKKGYAATCSSMEECGGALPSIGKFVIFVFLLEFIVFFDHWYVLHVWKWGKKHLKHDAHHKYEANDEMTTWTGMYPSNEQQISLFVVCKVMHLIQWTVLAKALVWPFVKYSFLFLAILCGFYR